MSKVVGPNRRVSKAVQEHCRRLAADVSFTKSSEHLCEVPGPPPAPDTVRALAASQGDGGAPTEG